MKTMHYPTADKNAPRLEIADAETTEANSGESATACEIESGARTVQFTPRQLEVLALLCEGLPNKQIARRLDIAEGTAKIHIANILRVFGVSNRLQAVIAAGNLGLEHKPVPPQSAQREPSPQQRRPAALRVVWDGTSSRLRGGDADDLPPAAIN